MMKSLNMVKHWKNGIGLKYSNFLSIYDPTRRRNFIINCLEKMNKESTWVKITQENMCDSVVNYMQLNGRKVDRVGRLF